MLLQVDFKNNFRMIWGDFAGMGMFSALYRGKHIQTLWFLGHSAPAAGAAEKKWRNWRNGA